MDRRERKREYKETPQPMGVYRITCRANGRSLVGASVNLPAILNRHRSMLRMGGHTDAVLQADWNEHGEDAFEFEALDTLEPKDEPSYDPFDDLTALAQLWSEKLQPRGYSPAPRVATTRS